MKSTLIDRVAVVWLGSALVLWTACLSVLWGWALDSSGSSAVLTVAATLLAVAAAMLVPRRVARAFQRVLIWLRLQDVLTMELSQAGAGRIGQAEARAMMKLLGGVAAFSAACGLASTAAILPARFLADALGAGFLWSPPSWSAVKLALQMAGMFPIALALAVAFLSTALLRRGSGRDVYACVCREWLWALAAGLAAFAAVLAAGADLLGAALATGVLLAASAAAILTRRKITLRPLRGALPVETTPGRGQELAVMAAYGVLAATILLQVRLLADLAGLHLPARMVWATFSLALLAAFLRREDSRARLPGGSQRMGAIIGLAAALMLQTALAVTCWSAVRQSWRPAAWACGLLAGAAQVPAAALAAVLFSRQRRIFAQEAGRARSYAASACLGGGLGLLGSLAAFSSGWGPVLILAAGMAMLAGGVLGGIGAARRKRQEWPWAGWGAALICCSAGAVLAAMSAACPPGQRLAAGAWLTSLLETAPRGGPPARLGCLPSPPVHRSDALSFLMAQIMNAGPQDSRRWWLIGSSDLDLPGQLMWRVPMAASSPDPAAGPHRWPWSAGRTDFLQQAQTSGQMFDGVLLAPLPVDHPHAWRCYNEQALRRCFQRTHGGGLMLLRTQARAGYYSAAIAVARTFREVVGPGWAVMELSGGQLDMLLMGPSKAMPFVPRPVGQDVYVVSTARLSKDWRQAGLVSLQRPQSLAWRRQPSATALWCWLEAAAEPPGEGPRRQTDLPPALSTSTAPAPAEQAPAHP